LLTCWRDVRAKKFRPTRALHYADFAPAPRALCVCRLNAKRPRGFPAGAIRTVDFLLHDLARIVKKVGVKTKDRALGRALINVQMSGFGG